MFLVKILLALAGLTASAQTVDPNTEAWLCDLRVTLLGDMNHFKYYGRDSWKGRATMTCEQTGGQETAITRDVDVTYNSFFEGFGADHLSVVYLTIRLSTTMDPREIQVRSLVTDSDPSENLRWILSSGATTGEANVTYADSVARNSLRNGSIYIRGAL